jgi:hypothetical protein
LFTVCSPDATDSCRAGAAGTSGEGNDDALFQIADRDEAPTSIRSWAGTLAVARREGLAVFSDDRVVRQSARELGLKAFSTMSLLDVLVDRGVVKPEVRDDVRHRLLRNGATGLRPAPSSSPN